MANTVTIPINKNTIDSHQISPHWVLTFVRFKNRDTKNYKEPDSLDRSITRDVFVVENDCISLSVNTSKKNYTPQAVMTLLGGDINYSTAVAPGDFVFVNILNSTQKAIEIRNKAQNLDPINEKDSGFKGLFKINNVSKIINVDPATGQKILRYQISARGFTEFNNVIYYNPTLGNAISKDVLTYFIQEKLLEVLNSKVNIQEVLRLLPRLVLGKEVENPTEPIQSVNRPPHKIPTAIFNLMGLTGQRAIDIYRIMIGVWGNNIDNSLNPIYSEDNSVQLLNKKLQGRIPIQTSPLTNVTLVDLLKRYSNELVNEMYFCYRVDRDRNAVLPKAIIRQKPFNTEHGKVDGTKFLSLPRWKVSTDLIQSINISKNESLRFNFVHIIGTTGSPGIDGANLAFQNATAGTIKKDEKDIERHGLRPYTKVSNFELTHGVDKRSNSNGPVYPEMDFVDTENDRADDFNRGDQILPGYSDSQDIPGRVNGEDVSGSSSGRSGSFTLPFIKRGDKNKK